MRRLVFRSLCITTQTLSSKLSKHDASHAWAYLPDLAATIAMLLARQNELQPFDVFHFGGHPFERGVELAEATRRTAGVPNAPIRSFPWFVMYLLAPFLETCEKCWKCAIFGSARSCWTTASWCAF